MLNCLGRCEQKLKNAPSFGGVSARWSCLACVCARGVSCVSVVVAWSLCLSLRVCGVVMLACGVSVVCAMPMLSWLAIPSLWIRHTQALINSLSYPFHSRSLGRVTRSEWVRYSALLH